MFELHYFLVYSLLILLLVLLNTTHVFKTNCFSVVLHKHHFSFETGGSVDIYIVHMYYFWPIH